MNKTNNVLKVVAICVICAATMMNGCIESGSEWKIDRTSGYGNGE